MSATYPMNRSALRITTASLQMSEAKSNTRIHVGTVLLVLGMIGGPLLVWGDAQRKDGQRDEKITVLEKRQIEDRKDTKEAIQKIDTKVERIDENVTRIRILLESTKGGGR